MDTVSLNIIRDLLANFEHDVSHLSDEELNQKVKVADAKLKEKGIDVNDGETYLSYVFRYID